MTLQVFDLRTRRPRNAVPGRLAPSWAVSAHSKSLNFQPIFLSARGHNLHGIFADADAISRRKARWRAMLLGADWSRDDVAGIPFADAVPHKRRASPPGADIGGVSVL